MILMKHLQVNAIVEGFWVYFLVTSTTMVTVRLVLCVLTFVKFECLLMYLETCLHQEYLSHQGFIMPDSARES